jgi:D-alanyl-D-alanine carboxypeptidase/D-alanyl-D-alanine-endopeptidase (penicillin-binding protein 4)
MFLRVRTRLEYLLVLGFVASAPAAETSLSLPQALHQHIAQNIFSHALWGVKVVTSDKGTVLFEHNAGQLLRPASNAKLYTAALALDRLGSDFKIQTDILGTTKPEGGVLKGDLMLFGRGDFSWSGRFYHGDYDLALSSLVRAITNLGIQKITGDLVADTTFFRGAPYGTGWTWDDLQNYYGAEVSALSFQDNVIDLTFSHGSAPDEPCLITPLPQTTYVRFQNQTKTLKAGANGSIHLYRPVAENVLFVSGGLGLSQAKSVDAVSVHDPAMWLLHSLKEKLLKEGITIEGSLRSIGWPGESVSKKPDVIQLASVNSPALSEMLPFMLKPSQNLYAQLLFLQVGAHDSRHAKDSQRTTEDVAILELRDFLKKSGIKSSEVSLQEGSGLSRNSLVTPNATVQLLRHMHHYAGRPVFEASLPVAGVDGTLRNRLKNKPVMGNLHAKTGTLSGVSTLSGYVTNVTGKVLTFSIMLNNYLRPENGPSASEAVDTVATLLATHPIKE